MSVATMYNHDDPDGLADKLICIGCVGDAYLAREMFAAANQEKCDYCSKFLEITRIGDLADRIEKAFEEHYIRTSEQMTSMQWAMMSDKESLYEWERDGSPIVDAIESAAEIPHAAAEDVQTILEERHADVDLAAMGEECEFSSDAYYDEKGPDTREWHEEWSRFERSLKTEARFFNQAAAFHLAEVFGDIDQLKTRDGRALVIDAGPGTALHQLYRARVFQDVRELTDALRFPDLQLGSPPPKQARAGRMNAQGVSVFYGATDDGVALAEVRAPVGSRVAVATFSITRPLRLLDLTALIDVHVIGSIFDSSYLRRVERAAFLRTLGDRMSRPVMPGDESLDYLPTQAVADFLATANVPRLDGIVFSSVQTADGRNVVLFHHASRVAAYVVPAGTQVTACEGYETDEGWEEDYSVSEQTPPSSEPEQRTSEDDFLDTILAFDFNTGSSKDQRESTLEVDVHTVAVHYVHSVKVNTTSHSVRRHRYERLEDKF
ncbi:RES family NAD+ phosphorylase [Burkholderia stabilis]|nr:RES family NAD+ phosphorylase [Burkholderia stabilis]